jgi:hypothetical protein
MKNVNRKWTPMDVTFEAILLVASSVVKHSKYKKSKLRGLGALAV